MRKRNAAKETDTKAPEDGSRNNFGQVPPMSRPIPAPKAKERSAECAKPPCGSPEP